MSRGNVTIVVFACLALGLPLVAITSNEYDRNGVHGCTGSCYEEWKTSSGGVVAIAQAQVEERASATPEEQGKTAYTGCVACHGAGGEGGIGPQLAGQTGAAIAAALGQYRAGETRGDQSVMMWSQAAELSDADIENLAAFIESL